MPGNIPDAPWSLTYRDGSNNSFWASQQDAGAQVTARYSPVKPEHSSSGTYSGGAPWEGKLSPAQADELWRRVRAMQKESKLHQRNRTMGSGSFTLESGGEKRALLIGRCQALAGLDSFLESLRK